MLSQIKTMELSSVTNVGVAGNTALSIEQEVQAAADKFGVDIIVLLMEKWDLDMSHALSEGKATLESMLNHYVRLKISLHHVKRYYDRYTEWNDESPHNVALKNRVKSLTEKSREARRNYYVAKRRVEGEHGTECTCRGCQCLGSLGR